MDDSQATIGPGTLVAVTLGLSSSVLSALCLAQAEGADRGLFLPLGLILAATGLLGIVAGGVALGIHLARS